MKLQLMRRSVVYEDFWRFSIERQLSSPGLLLKLVEDCDGDEQGGNRQHHDENALRRQWKIACPPHCHSEYYTV